MWKEKENSFVLFLMSMGCGNTKTAPMSRQEPDNDLRSAIDGVQRTWPSIKKIDNLGPKVFAK